MGQKDERRKEGTNLIARADLSAAAEVITSGSQRRWGKSNNRRNPGPSSPSPLLPPSLSGKFCVFRTQRLVPLLSFKNSRRDDEVAQWVQELAAKN